MTPEMTRHDALLGPTTSRPEAVVDPSLGARPVPEVAIDAILDDCFLSFGQSIGLRASLDYDAVLFLRGYFRPKFLAAMRTFGNRWLEDRANVTAVGGMLAERAVRYANGASTIGLDEIRKAAADVERYCHVHAARHGGDARTLRTDGATKLIAGYWCTLDPEP